LASAVLAWRSIWKEQRVKQTAKRDRKKEGNQTQSDRLIEELRRQGRCTSERESDSWLLTTALKSQKRR
jgi:hypothetical protein